MVQAQARYVGLPYTGLQTERPRHGNELKLSIPFKRLHKARSLSETRSVGAHFGVNARDKSASL